MGKTRDFNFSIINSILLVRLQGKLSEEIKFNYHMFSSHLQAPDHQANQCGDLLMIVNLHITLTEDSDTSMDKANALYVGTEYTYKIRG